MRSDTALNRLIKKMDNFTSRPLQPLQGAQSRSALNRLSGLYTPVSTYVAARARLVIVPREVIS
ncbi:hypothetical protein E2C01_091116 [Portunus trituberculatus]|uniref:Uncharacterized protein n=1 Tax=Portunus trituberculatus TaxID=210409 RepID=A0A5B7JRX6_PORTR|nr:hypothetical protein [Portunus trituberculatus]